MLVLSRKAGEGLRFTVSLGGEQLEFDLTLLDIDRNKLRIGIDADNRVQVMRKELIEEKQ